MHNLTALSQARPMKMLHFGYHSLFPSVTLKTPKVRLAPPFSSQYHPWIKYKGHDNSENELQFKRLLIVKQILLVNFSIRNGIQGDAKKTR